MAKALDLHGYKKDEVFDAVDAFLLKASNSGAKTATIIPGKGKGIVKSEVIKYLKQAGYPWSYEKNKGKTNEGVMIIHLD